ncbi:complexed with cef1p [Coemansia sp. RSA 988]|nr:complexed with cef1p [Coemansia sp. RSA 988]
MTTAARPTFDPAKGKESNEFTYLTSAKDLPGHTKLKTRKPGQGGDSEHTTTEELRKELEEAERRHFETRRLGHVKSGTEEHADNQEALESEKARYIEMAHRLDAESEESDDGDSDDSEGQSDGENDGKATETDSDEDSEDETALLLRELEKIKRERAEERARDEQQALERRLMEEESGGPSLVGGNPLLGKRDFSVKRRWDDDVVFRNQARGDDDKSKKRFVNDMLRSDFHQKFMRKYMH